MIMSEPGFQPFLADRTGSGSGFRNWDDRLWPQADAPVVPADEYARGLADGQQLAATAFAEERLRLKNLLASAAALQPTDSSAIHDLLLRSVERLVTSIVGQVPTDTDWLHVQITEALDAAAKIDAARKLWLHPDDLALVANTAFSVEMHADPSLCPGSMRVETGSGWVEHGRMVMLDALRTELGGSGGSL